MLPCTFLWGFCLAQEPAELNHYEENRHPSSAGEAEIDACFLP